MIEQSHWRIEFVNNTNEIVYGARPHVSKDGHLLLCIEMYGSGVGEKDRREFVLANVITWEKA